MEHLQHFGLTQDPFSNEPDLRYFFESASHRDAQRRVERGLRQHKGLTLLTGDGGMGKTLLARRILDGLEEEVFEATLLVMLPGAADATGILQRFARQLGAEEPAADRAGLLSQIYEHLAIVREDGRHAVLMIDDAQIMTPTVFSELAGMLNLEYEDRRLLSMLFVGSTELDNLVQNDPSITPRIDVRVRLQPLDLEDTKAYLTHRLASASADASLVPMPAVEALYKFGRGRPRLLNTLADNALFEAYLAGRTALEPADIERAAADLGIGPDPGTTYSLFSSAPAPLLHSESAESPVPEVSVPPVSPEDSDPFAAGADLLLDSPPSLELDDPVPSLDLDSDSSAPFGLEAEASASFALEPETPVGFDAAPDTPMGFEAAPDTPASIALEPETPAAIDLDAGLEAALDEFGTAAPTETPSAATLDPSPAAPSTPTAELTAEEPFEVLEFEMEPLPGEAPPPEDLSFAMGADAAEAPMIELEEAELSPMETDDLDELEDAFVELIEE